MKQKIKKNLKLTKQDIETLNQSLKDFEERTTKTIYYKLDIDEYELLKKFSSIYKQPLNTTLNQIFNFVMEHINNTIIEYETIQNFKYETIRNPKLFNSKKEYNKQINNLNTWEKNIKEHNILIELPIFINQILEKEQKQNKTFLEQLEQQEQNKTKS